MTKATPELRRAAVAALLMLAGAAAGWKLTPRTPMSTQSGDFQLETAVPKAFGDWQIDTRAGGAVVNPQQEALIRQLYSQTLSRVYVSSRGERVMLSIAYGNDQRDGMQMHYPEICYPAQGFQLRSSRAVELDIDGRRIPARQLLTVLGNQRYEPVTYWTVIGTTAVRGGVDKKLVEMRYGFRDLIPDGLLFRVSSIDRDQARAHDIHRQFAEQLLAATPPAYQRRLAGEQASPP